VQSGISLQELSKIILGKQQGEGYKEAGARPLTFSNSTGEKKEVKTI